MTYALRDTRTGQVTVLSILNPLNFVTDQELRDKDLLPEHIERIEVEVRRSSERK